ncbi:HNH endonuclease [Microbacterium atlanticum]|uniref:HNH endonuclease n=1 Tax=Microbacterium atlanticum TaxID=2782168 RepID=UPI0018875166|nr:HNH endonuclease signature motif containing protein [Microbacterium atlanticum]
MIDDAPPDPTGAEWDAVDHVPPVPDAVDLVLETAAMMATFAAERLVRVDAMRREMLTDAAARGVGLREVVERSIRLELAAGMRITEYAAGRLILQAEALVNRYPTALDALWGGRITERHAEILVDLVDQTDGDLRPVVIERAVALAEAEPVGTFRRGLRDLIARLESRTLEQRHAAAAADRRISVEAGADGMGSLLLYAPIVELHAIHGRVTAMAKAITAGDGETRTLDQVRADIVADLLIDGSTDHTPASASGIRASVVVTVPVLSLFDDEAASPGDPPVVEGVGPIPLSRARELCGGDAKWMRVLTHPETGMVLSVGRDRYEPPAALRRLVRWRADRCMGPGCGMPASRCEVDHQIRWVDQGETALENTAPLCKGHHLVKDNGQWKVTQIPGSGGALEWISPTGRRYVVQPERRVPVFASSRSFDGSDAPF